MNSFEKKWQIVSDMAHEAREKGGMAWIPAVNGRAVLALWRQGPLTRFFIGDKEVSGMVFADAVEANGTSLLAQPAEGDDLVVGYKELPAADLTKRELAEIHVLAGVLASIKDSGDAVDRTVESVRILMDEWAERDGRRMGGA